MAALRDARHRRERGELENEVLGVLAVAGRPLTPAEVLAALERDLAYTTVMTTLGRLHRKDVVVRQRAGRAYAYAPAGDAMTAARQMRRMLDRGSDRGDVLAHFLDELDPADVPVLQRLLSQAEPPSPGNGGG